MMIVLKFHVILLIIYDYRASIVELRNAKNRAQGGPVREPIKTGRVIHKAMPHPVRCRRTFTPIILQQFITTQ